MCTRSALPKVLFMAGLDLRSQFVSGVVLMHSSCYCWACTQFDGWESKSRSTVSLHYDLYTFTHSDLQSLSPICKACISPLLKLLSYLYQF